MPRIVFIQPFYENKKLDRNYKTVYPLGLGYLASYVPFHWDVKIVDEQVEKIDFNMNVDIVGITTTSLTVNRAYEIAKKFKKRGVRVVIGGVHASMCPEEAIKFCDSVCIGDGEFVIKKIIDDYENNCLKNFYNADIFPLNNIRFPRRDLFKDNYQFIPISTTRGCPMRCSFCAIHNFYKGSFRKRDVEDVIKEMKELPTNRNIVFFTDGNAYGFSQEDRKRFQRLCKRIIEEKKKDNIKFKYFMCYVPLNALADIETLDLASKAGCGLLLVGFESVNKKTLEEMNKKVNLKLGIDSYNKLIENANKRKILVLGELIIGNDADDKETLIKTRKFIKNSNMDNLRLHVLQPLPGTKVFDKLKKENRLYLKNFPEDWKHLRDDFLIGIHFKLNQLDPIKLRKWVKKVSTEFYSYKNILKKAWKAFKYSKSLKVFITTFIMNIKTAKTYKNLKL